MTILRIRAFKPLLSYYVNHKKIIDRTFLFLLLTGYTISVYQRGTDFPVVYEAGNRMLQLERITYFEAHAFSYPPFFAFISIPLALLPYQLAKMSYFFLSVGALLMSVIWLKKIIENSERFKIPEDSHMSKFFTGIYLLLTARFIINNFEHLQSDMFVLLSMTGGLYFFTKGKNVHSALMLALGASIKVTPFLILIYFLWKREWKLFALGLIFTITLNLLPDIFFGSNRDNSYLSEWTPLISGRLNPQETLSETDEVWGLTSRMNQSLSTTLQRYFTDAPVITYSDHEVHVNMLSLEPKNVKLIALFIILIMAAGFAWVTRKKYKSRSDDRYLVEYALALILILLASPVSSKPHFSILLLSHALIIASIYHGQLNKGYLNSLIFAFILSTLMVDGIVGIEIGRYFEALGNVTFHAVTAGSLVLIILLNLKPKITGQISR